MNLEEERSASTGGPPAVHYRLLGAPEVVIGSRAVPLPSSRPAAVLVALLLHPNEPVSVDHLYEVVWGAGAPANARAKLQTYVSRLRQLFTSYGLADCPLRTVPRGYAVAVDPDGTDVLRFRTLVASARHDAATGGLERESDTLAAALSLWRGTALTNVRSEALQRDEVPRLTEERLAATERHIDVELMLGRYRAVVPQLRLLTSAYPQRERFWEQIVEALYRGGRQAEALGEYQKIKRYLREDLGIDPSAGLQRLELAILRGERLDEPVRTAPAPAAPHPPAPMPPGTSAPHPPEPMPPGASAPRGAPTPAPAPRPACPPAPRPAPLPTASSTAVCQLPPQVPGFVGREETERRIVAELTHPARATPAIAVLSGPPGVGKSALALRVAHRVRRHFPDGQWYARLTDADGNARAPAEILAELLQAAGVERHRIPDAPAARPAAFRASIADRRVLLLLDDVVDMTQVQPLMPGTPGCAALVTGRRRLAQLPVLLGVRSHQLGELSREESVDLLARVLGRDVVDAGSDDVAELVRLCDRLPLALRIAAAKILDRPGTGITRMVDELRRHPLDGLAIGRGPTISLRRAFDESYARLTPSAQRAFCLIGRALAGTSARSVPGLEEIAAQHDTGLPDVPDAVTELLDANLIDQTTPGRIVMRPLLRRYAEARAAERGQRTSDRGRRAPTATDERRARQMSACSM